MAKIEFPNFSNLFAVRRDKSTKIQEGHPFEELRAVEETRKFQRLITKEFGEEIEADETRPWKGAFSIVDERIVAMWLQLLENNGLRRFSDRITIDWFTRAEILQKGKLQALKTPVVSELVFQFPCNNRDNAIVLFRIAIIDPQFLDSQCNPIYKEIPAEYITAVLHTLNPFVLYQIFGKSLPEMLQHSGQQSQAFGQMLKYIAGKAKTKATPSDFETLQEYVHAMIIHEMVHALALHLPDQVPKDLPDDKRNSLESVNFDRYLELINADQSLMTSALFFKNLIKALQKVQNKVPSDETAADVINLLTLEMFCDRFSMYLYDNFVKMGIYNKYLQKISGYPLNSDMFITLELARKANQLSTRFEVSRMNENDRIQMETDLSAAEQNHVFIRCFSEPFITPKEWNFYTAFLNWLKQLDLENQILRFPMQHADTSRFMHVSVAGMTQDSGLEVTDSLEKRLQH